MDRRVNVNDALYRSAVASRMQVLSNKLNDCRSTCFKKKHYSEGKFVFFCSVMGTPKDLTNRIIFVLLIGFIGWQLLRLGLIVGVANGWM